MHMETPVLELSKLVMLAKVLLPKQWNLASVLFPTAKCQENSLVSIGHREIWFLLPFIQMTKHPQCPQLRIPNECFREESGRKAADCLLNPVGTVLLASQRDLGWSKEREEEKR